MRTHDGVHHHVVCAGFAQERADAQGCWVVATDGTQVWSRPGVVSHQTMTM